MEAATERKIRSVTLTASDAPVAFDEQRGVSYDILCIFDDGLPANLEMQAFNQQYDYGKRAEYQVSRLETTYLKRGDSWKNAPKVYQITVLDFTYDAESKDVISRYAMRTKNGRELALSLNVIFIELPKVTALEASLESNSPLENWAIFLKDADNPAKRGLIAHLTSREAGLMQAQKSLSNISANRDLWIAQYRQELLERDRRSGLEALETARNMIADNLPFAQIAKWTGLTVAEKRFSVVAIGGLTPCCQCNHRACAQKRPL